MGSGSSSPKKAPKVMHVEEEPSLDIKAVERLKRQTKILENILGDDRRLQEYIKAVNDRQKADKDLGEKTTDPHTDKEQLVTDTVEKLVGDLIDYVDMINVSFDDLQGSLELFHDAIVRRFEESKSAVQKGNIKGNIQEILNALDTRVKSAKDRLSVVKQQNVTPEILRSTEAELREYSNMKDDLDKQYKIIRDKRNELVNELKDRGVYGNTIDEILRWKEDVVKLERKYGHVITENDQMNDDTKTRLKELKESNEALLSEVDALQRQCLESDKNVLDANDNVQRVEEKILEERLTHEVEINALKALLEKKSKLIRKLGGSDMDIPMTPTSDEKGVLQIVDLETEKKHDYAINKNKSNLSKHKTSRNIDSGSESDDEVKFKHSDPSSTKKQKRKSLAVLEQQKGPANKETTETKASVGTQLARMDECVISTHNTEEINDKSGAFNICDDKNRSDKGRSGALPRNRQVPDDNVVNDTEKDELIYVSTGVQVSEEELSEAVNIKLGEKEDTSSDLGLSVKSEFIQNTPDLLDEGNDSGQDITGDRKRTDSDDAHTKYDGGDTTPLKSNNTLQKTDNVFHKTSDTKTPDSSAVNGMVSPSQSTNTDTDDEKPISVEDTFPESFADMIQLVSKDDCITTLETKEEDVHIYEGTTKEIIYKRNDGGIDWDVAYHKGIGAVVRTTHEMFGIDTIRVDIIDEVENTMLPDLVFGERPISFHLHIREKGGTHLELQENDVKVFVPHRPLKEYEDVTLIYSLNGEDWEDCDIVDELPASLDSNVDIVGTVLPDIRDVKLVAIARERMVDLIAGEGDISYVSSFDESIRVNISKDTFRSHTIAKLLVHHSHILGLQSAVNMHEECRNISSCTAFICIECASVTRNNILVDMDVPHAGVNEDDECRYTMFCLNESGWKLADCTWDLANRRLTINLMPGSRSYRIIGIDVPMSIHMEERLAAVKTLHEHTSHYQVCVFVRQRLDDPQQAVVMCLRSHLTDQAISELSDKGFSMGQLISDPFCIMDGDVLSLAITGNIMAKPINSEKMTMTFYPQREMSTRLLLLLPVEAGDQPASASGTISIIKHETDENVDVLSGAIGLSSEI